MYEGQVADSPEVILKDAKCLCCIPIRCGILSISALYLCLCFQILFTAFVFINIKKQVGLKMKHVNLSKSNFSGSMKFYWVLWAFDAMKLYCLPVVLFWLLSRESTLTRMHLSISFLICWISSLLSIIFGIIGIYLMRDFFFPRGLTKDNLSYAGILLLSGVCPLALEIYFWTVSIRYNELNRQLENRNLIT